MIAYVPFPHVPLRALPKSLPRESASAFARAFLRAFEATPSTYRAAGERMSPVPPRSGPLPENLPGPRIAEYPERDVLALHFVGPYDALAPVMFRLYSVALKRRFLPHGRVFGLSYDSPDLEEDASLRFDACVAPCPGADVTGARADGHAYDVLFASWILTGRLELRAAPFINTYLSVPGTAGELECDLAIPIR